MTNEKPTTDDEQREPNPAAVPIPEPAEQADDDSLVDDMIESITELPEKAVHWLLRPIFGGKD
jgi:hypothetical protein